MLNWDWKVPVSKSVLFQSGGGGWEEKWRLRLNSAHFQLNLQAVAELGKKLWLSCAKLRSSQASQIMLNLIVFLFILQWDCLLDMSFLVCLCVMLSSCGVVFLCGCLLVGCLPMGLFSYEIMFLWDHLHIRSTYVLNIADWYFFGRGLKFNPNCLL